MNEMCQGLHTNTSVLLPHLNSQLHPRRVVASKSALDGEHAPPQKLGVDGVVVSRHCVKVSFDTRSEG